MRVTDIVMAFPRLILALALVAVLKPGLINAVIAIAITAWPPYARSPAPKRSIFATPNSSRPRAPGMPRARSSRARSCRSASPR
jgi:hypothetical protein